MLAEIRVESRKDENQAEYEQIKGEKWMKIENNPTKEEREIAILESEENNSKKIETVFKLYRVI